MHPQLWSNPEELNLSNPFIYYIRLIDSSPFEWRYIGKASKEARIREYDKNIYNIAQGLPRRSNPQDLSNQKYRAVHFGLAKALELGWEYEFFPLQSVSKESLNEQERYLQSVYRCNLNGGERWDIEQYRKLSLRDLIPNPPY